MRILISPIMGRLALFAMGAFTRNKAIRYTILLFFIGVIPGIANASYSQDEISVSIRNQPLERAFKVIEENSEYFFLYNKDLINIDQKVSIDERNNSIESILNKLFYNTGIAYSISQKQIILSPKKIIPQRSIKGKVTDENGAPLIGVTVFEKGTSNATITDMDGDYTLSNISDSSILVFSSLGLKTKEMQVGQLSTLNATLEEDLFVLDEVVAIGYGTLSKRKVSGSITNITEENFNKGATQNVADLLQGKVAGLAITTETGDVTAEQTMRLRGTSSLTGSSAPFIVIDGIPGMEMNSVAPQDIESISVLKDASAVAIYGSRAASGVILITTKKGMPGQSDVSYNSYIAFDQATRLPNMLSATQWREYTQDMDVTGLDLGADTNWFKEITRTGISHNHNLSISGGLENGNYRASINYLNREGVMKDNEMERYNLLFSLNKRALNDRLKIALSGGAVLSDYTPSNAYNSVLAYNMLPVYPVKNPDGSWFSIQEFDQGNPVHNIAENSNLFKTSLLYGSFKADLELAKGLVASANLFKQRKTADNSRYNSITSQAGRQDRGYALRGGELWDKDLMELTAEYNLETKEHYFNVLGGYSYEYNEYQRSSAANRTFITDDFQYDNLAAGENLFPSDVNSYRNMYKLISFFGRFNYVFMDRYILTGALRRDGSSKFGKNHKWGTFPSISAAWRISDEPFFDQITTINDLKFRMGYGVVGNQSGIDPYTSIALYSRSDQYFDNGTWRNTYKYAQNDNPDLKWEETNSLNWGLDFALFNSRLSGAIDYYIKKTNDLLYVYNVPVPPYLYPTMLANVGDISNKGVEFQLNGDIIRGTDFNWSASINLAHNKNVIEKLSNDLFQTDNIRTGYISLRGSGYLTSHIIEEGREIGTFYNLKSNGLDENGKFIIEDLNNDGIINTQDYTYIGSAMPDLTYGIHNSFSYKNFDLSFAFRGVLGNDVINSPRIQYSNSNWLPGGNVLEEVLHNGIHDDPLFSSYFIESGSFLRLDNLSLSYNTSRFKSMGLKNMKFFGTAQNLFVITNFDGPDPEVRMSGLDPGILDHAFVPRPRTYTLGVEVKF